MAQVPYLEEKLNLHHLYLYHHQLGSKGFYALFLPPTKKAFVFVLDTVVNYQLPNMNNLYSAEWTARISQGQSMTYT